MDERRSLQRFKSDMAISAPAAERVSREFQKQIEQGVQANTPNIHTMIPSMVARVPTGHEQGPFYGIHISGEHIHMLYTILSDVPYQVDLVQIQSSAISENLRTCTDEDFFAHVAQAFHAFLRSISRVLTGASNAACGLALSFPCLNESVQCGRLTKWTKGFDIAGTVGKDPAQMLSNAFAAQGINVKVVALCNNTVAELCVTRYRGLHADVALSMDTGSNASFEEAVEQIAKLDRGAVKALTHESMIINTEWPAFEPQTVRLLPEDFEVDDKSQRPGDQLFEKLTAPLYLGEVARLILIRVAEEQGWPEADNMQLRSLPGDLHVEQVIAVAEDTTQSLSLVRTLLQTIFKIDTTYFSQQVCQQVKEISVLVLARSAKLVAAAIVGIMLHKLHSSGLQAEPFTVAFAGKLSASHVYRRLLREALQEFSLWICPEYHPVKVLEVDDGAVFGAAVLAAATFASP